MAMLYTLEAKTLLSQSTTGCMLLINNIGPTKCQQVHIYSNVVNKCAKIYSTTN